MCHFVVFVVVVELSSVAGGCLVAAVVVVELVAGVVHGYIDDIGEFGADELAVVVADADRQHTGH